MTNAIGNGTCNVPVNMLADERAILGRLAFRANLSTGEFLRRIIRRGVAMTNPEEAKQLARLRRDRVRAAAMLCLLCCYTLAGGSEMRRPAARVRISRRYEP